MLIVITATMIMQHHIDPNKNITTIIYNHLHLAVKIQFGTDPNTKIEYLYNAVGQKLKKTVYSIKHDFDLNTSYNDIDVTDYLNGFQYTNDKLSFFPTTEGYVKNTVTGGTTNNFSYVYNYTDHLGNIRMSYTRNTDGTLAFLEENHYYPFGLKHNNYSSEVNDLFGGEGDSSEAIQARAVEGGGRKGYQYKYNGKELQDELGLNLYDFGARNYDPAIGRWMNIDPLADKYYNISPYVYVANSPLLYIDPDGKEIIVANKADQGAVLKMINSKALGTFAFNKAGKLYLAKAAGDATKYSAYYQKQLVAAINDKEKINVSIGQTYQDKGVTKSVDTDAGGGVTLKKTRTSTDPTTGAVTVTKEADVIISGNPNTNLKDTNGNPLTDNADDILAHELVGHAIPHITNPDTGNAVDNENKVRKEQQTPERKLEPSHTE